MKLSLIQLRSQADSFYKKGELLPAVRLYISVLRRNPEDYEARMGLADALAAVGATIEASRVYEATARLCTDGGRPLVAIVAARSLQSLGKRADHLVARLSALYSRGSKRLAPRGGRLNPRTVEFDVDAREFRRECTVAELIDEAVGVGTELEGVSELPLRFPPIPLLSELSPVRMVKMIRAMIVHRVPAGRVVFRRGDPGHSCFLVAKGRVRVLGEHSKDSEGREELAVLTDGAVFGEMSLVSGMPRSATVQAVEDTDLLELGPEALAAIDDELTQLAPVLHKLASKRWLANLMQHHPMFRVFESDSDRRELLQRFQALKVPRGTMLFAQGEVARGIYLVASGEVGLMHRDRPDGAPQLVQRVGPGSVPGIESLISDTPSPLSATALSPTTVLFLSRATYQRLASAVPEVVEALRLLPSWSGSEREASQVC